MELLDRYLQAVKFWLPKAKKDDIVAELSEDIRSQIEEKEAALGRQLNGDEMEAILKGLGHPLLVAERYLPQRYLIGPVLFPFYRFVLQIVAVGYLAPSILVWICYLAFSPVYRAAHPGLLKFITLRSQWLIMLSSFFFITIGFALVEKFKLNSMWMKDWNPRKLPAVRDQDRVPRGESVFELAASIVGLVWWLSLIPTPTIVRMLGVQLTLTPTSLIFFWAILFLLLATTAIATVNLFRPYRTSSRACFRLAIDLVGAVVFCGLLKAQIVAAISTPNLSGARAIEITNSINTSVARLFPFAVGLCVMIAILDIRRIIRLTKVRTPLTSCLAVILVLTLLAGHLCAQTTRASAATASSLASDEQIRQILADRIDVQHKSVGMVVGIVTPQGRRIISYGRPNQGDPRPLNGDTVFEIGSVTKVFTALLLADMVQRGEVTLADPVAQYLPAGVKPPERNGKKITLVDLATHTSGLPFFPSDIPLTPLDEAIRITAKYSTQQLYDFLAGFQLPRDIGSKWEYSNLGMSLLGMALANRAGTDYESLIHARVTGPLHMASTSIALSPEMKLRLSAGHDAALHPAPAVEMPAFVAAGALRSTANDLLTFLAAFAGNAQSPLAPAMAAMLKTQRPGPGFPQALGWWIVLGGQGDDGIVTHGGETPGYTCTVATDLKTRFGVVVLSNSAENDGGLAWHLLRPGFPVETSAMAQAIGKRKEISLEPRSFKSYTGQYQAPAPGGILTIEQQGEFLVFKSESAPQGLRLHAEDERNFFVTETDLRFTFQTDLGGYTTNIIIHFAGRDTAASRVPGDGK